MGRQFWAMCVCCSPAALRETPPAPPVTLLRYPAVIRLALQQQPPHPPRPQPQPQLQRPLLLPPPPQPQPQLTQLQLKVNTRESVCLTYNTSHFTPTELGQRGKKLTRSPPGLGSEEVFRLRLKLNYIKQVRNYSQLIPLLQ